MVSRARQDKIRRIRDCRIGRYGREYMSVDLGNHDEVYKVGSGHAITRTSSIYAQPNARNRKQKAIGTMAVATRITVRVTQGDKG